MPRYPYPPHDFECLYRYSCPYLDGLSTQWVLEEYRRAHEVYQEHLRIIDLFDGHLKDRDERIRVLERENAQLKAKLQSLHRRQFKPNKKKEAQTGGKNAESPSSSNERGKKKRGAPVGHPGWVRPKPDHIDRTVKVPAPTICPHCQSNHLRPIQETTEHVQEDIVIQPRTLVTCYLHGQAFCPRCNRPVVQAAEGELLNAPIGPVAKSVAIYLRYRIGIPYRKTTELLRELFGLSLVPASALGFDRKAASQGTPLYEDLRDKVRASDVVHADETSWRGDGVGHYVWFAGNENLSFFLSFFLSFISTGIGLPRWPKTSSEKTLTGPSCATAMPPITGSVWTGRLASPISPQKRRKSKANMRSCPKPTRTLLSAPSATASSTSAHDSATRGRSSNPAISPGKGRPKSKKDLSGNSIPSANSRFGSNPPRPSGPILQAPNKDFSLPFSDVPAYRPRTITPNSLSDIW